MTHPFPRWRVVNFDEVLRGDTYGVFEIFEDVARLSTRTETETWLCNHCSDYLAPSSQFSFGRIPRVGSKWEAIRHVQMAYVRFHATVFFRLRFPFYRHNVEEPLVDVDVFSYPMFVTY